MAKYDPKPRKQNRLKTLFYGLATAAGVAGVSLAPKFTALAQSYPDDVHKVALVGSAAAIGLSINTLLATILKITNRDVFWGPRRSSRGGYELVGYSMIFGAFLAGLPEVLKPSAYSSSFSHPPPTAEKLDSSTCPTNEKSLIATAQGEELIINCP